MRWRDLCVAAMILVLCSGAAYWWGYVSRPAGTLPEEILIHADSAVQNDSFAIATGPIDEDVEGLWVLDFLTGELQCSILNYRTAKFSSYFRGNVIQDLGIDPEKRPKYLLSTGRINFPRGAAIARPAMSVVYVLDTTTGTYAAYGLPWRRELAASGRAQIGALTLLDVGKARTAALRE